MPVLYVARSASLSKWASDVGLSKHVFKVGLAEADALKDLLASGWAGQTDWTLVKKQDVELADEDEILGRLAKKEKLVDPALYPRIRGERGIYKVIPTHVENHMLVTRALGGEESIRDVKVKPADFGDYLIKNALR
jgi:hypothetical protein